MIIGIVFVVCNVTVYGIQVLIIKDKWKICHKRLLIGDWQTLI